MSDSPSAKTVEAEHTDVRFGTRSLLAAMIAVAILATILGSFARFFPSDERFKMAVYWGLLGAVLTVVCVVNAWSRHRAEKLAGRVYFRLARHSYFFPRSPRLAFLVRLAYTLLLCMGFLLFYSFLVAHGALSDFGVLYSLYPAFFAGGALTLAWWRRRIRICENGVVSDNWFIPWDRCRWFYWDAVMPSVIVIEWRQAGRIAASVPLEQHDVVESLLRNKMRKDAADSG
jgi:hypothetical protein